MRGGGVVAGPASGDVQAARVAGLVRTARLRAGYSQEELAARTGLGVRTIRDLERGRVRRPQHTSVRLLAEALTTSTAERTAFAGALAPASDVPAPALAEVAAGAAPLTAVVTAPQQLPASVPDLTGRDALVEDTVARLRGGTAAGSGTVVAVTGRAGVGKTAFAVHVAHRVHDAFPDGRLWADLRGQERPADPADVLAWFLRALGVRDATVPATLAERSAWYRALLVTRRVLVVLDDVADETQVRPLLPGGGASATLLTSRRLPAALEGVVPVRLEVLGQAEAAGLLARLAGSSRVAAEPAAAADVVALCGGLPLALRVAGAQLAARPHWRLAHLRDLLADEQSRLDVLTVGDLDVRAALAHSYRGLPEDGRRALSRVAMLDAPDVPAWAVAALLDVPLQRAEPVVERLVDDHLLEAVGTDGTGHLRYRLHDLVRTYGRERAAIDETADQGALATARALGAWLALAERADRHLPSASLAVDHSGARRWHLEAEAAGRLTRDARAWFAAEWPALAAGVEQAARLGLADLAWDLAGSIANFAELRSDFDGWRRLHERALGAARSGGDERGELAMLRGLVELHMDRAHHDHAVALVDRAVALSRRLGDRATEAHLLDAIGGIQRARGEHERSLVSHRRALALFRRQGNDLAAAYVRYNLGVTHLDSGRTRSSSAYFSQAEAAFSAAGDRRGVAYARWRLGQVATRRGDAQRAAAWLDQALSDFRALGERLGEACTLLALGELASAVGDAGDAQESLLRAERLFSHVGAPRWQARATAALRGGVGSGVRRGPPACCGRYQSRRRSTRPRLPPTVTTTGPRGPLPPGRQGRTGPGVRRPSRSSGSCVHSSWCCLSAGGPAARRCQGPGGWDRPPEAARTVRARGTAACSSRSRMATSLRCSARSAAPCPASRARAVAARPLRSAQVASATARRTSRSWAPAL